MFAKKTVSDAQASLHRSCTHHLSGHGPETEVELFESLAAHQRRLGESAASDRYGSGPLLQAFEREIATLMGMEDAIFMPSGTMAQVIALRIWSERAGSNRVGFHPTSHLEQNENRAYSRLHGLEATLVGDRTQGLRARDLETLPEKLSCYLLELPLRRLGGILPEWEELEAIKKAAAARGTKLHLDGARLWESQPFYGRSFAEICRGFDSVYLSFYKGLGGLSGSMLCGPADFIAEARVWLRRHGGNLYTLHPNVLSAKVSFDLRRDRFASYRERAIGLARAIQGAVECRIRPEIPHTNMMHVFLPRPVESLIAARDRIASEDRFWLGGAFWSTDVPGWSMMEVWAGDSALGWSEQELIDRVAPAFKKLLGAGA